MKKDLSSVIVLLSAGAVVFPSIASGHSVAQLQTAKRIAESTIVALDPQKGTVGAIIGTDTNARVGDILTYVIQFTPVPNSATRGAGGYITEYVPPNTEVVGARFIDKDGNTVKPHRGPQMDDGFGPRGAGNFSAGLEEGSLSQLYADTGIFYSTSVLTERYPNDSLIKVLNGYEFNGDQANVIPEILALGGGAYVPKGATSAKALYQILTGADPGVYYAHNRWDYIQTLAYGVGGGTPTQVSDGNGNTPFGFGSFVAGPQTYYQFQKVFAPACWGLSDPGCASDLDDDLTGATDAPVGPWQRIRYTGSEIGTGAQCDLRNCASDYVRVGVPTDLGWDLSADNPLPAGTNAVRFAVGELVVGEEYLVEISVRVTGLPLDPNTGDDTNCAEVSGGDAAMPQNGQDNPWRYFAPAPSCVSLNLVFDLSVDKIVASGTDVLTYTLRVKNLSTEPQTDVVVTSAYNTAKLENAAMVGGTPDPASDAGGVITWPTIASLAPGEERIYTWTMDTKSTDKSTVTSASYVSAEQTDPFTVLALTTLEQIAVFQHTATVSQPSPSAAEGDVVTYTVTIANTGTGVAAEDGGNDYIRVHLPAGISYCDSGDGCADPTLAPSAGGSTDPGWSAANQQFETLADIPPGEFTTLTFQARIVDSTPDLSGIYTINVQTQYDDPNIGRQVEKTTFDLAPLRINATQTAAPSVSSTILAGATSVSGTGTAGDTIRVFINGNEVDDVVVGGGGKWTASVPTLFAGQRVTATAQSAGEVESEQSVPVVVTGTSAGSGTTGEAPQCSDGIDNDGDGQTDYPDDKSCTSYLDDTEGNTPECEDGVDNDDDGQTDVDDPDCKNGGNSEQGVPACADGIDNDGDGKVDYPTDPQCGGPTDDDEELDGSQMPTGDGDGATGDGDTSMGSGDGDSAGDGDAPEDLGGLEEPLPGSGSGDPGDESGCGCRVAGSTKSGPGPEGLLLTIGLMGAWIARRRRGMKI